jgi:hypothetical protein
VRVEGWGVRKEDVRGEGRGERRERERRNCRDLFVLESLDGLDPLLLEPFAHQHVHLPPERLSATSHHTSTIYPVSRMMIYPAEAGGAPS